MKRKVCRRCGRRRAASMFNSEPRNTTDGLSSWCKDCARENARAWYARNRERAREQRRIWREQNPEKTREHERRYRERNPENAKAHQAAWRERNRAELRLRHRLRLWTKFGLDEEGMRRLFDEQAGLCAICSTPFVDLDFHADHSHRTMTARGLLCPPCNHGIGRFGDDPAKLRAAANYLERYQ